MIITMHLKNRNSIFLIFLSGLLLLPINSKAQEATCLQFCFYNVENLFDIYNDSLTNDDEFTPEGDKHWSSSRYYTKIDQIARVLTGMGAWELPALVGLSEIENAEVLYDLVNHRLLDKHGYKIIHKDSPDRRGIDVALLYAPNAFIVLHKEWININFPFDSNLRTRDILYVKGVVLESDTLHLFINHWPSRWGGIEATLPKRVEVARTLRHTVDSLFLADDDPAIIIAGDLNDTPGDSSVHKVLGAIADTLQDDYHLVNLMYPKYINGKEGSMKYRENWEIFDHIIVSPAAFEFKHSDFLLAGPFLYDPPYLLTEDERYLGVKPYRTYSGPRYLGGYSDHLPVYIRYKHCEIDDGGKLIRGERKPE